MDARHGVRGCSGCGVKIPQAELYIISVLNEMHSPFSEWLKIPYELLMTVYSSVCQHAIASFVHNKG